MGYVYSHNRRTEKCLYLRCKHRTVHQCKASVVVRSDNFQEALKLREHNHESLRKDLDRVKFNKKLEQIVREDPFITALGAYQKAKRELEEEVIGKNIPSLKSFESLIYRLQKDDVPLLPKTVADLEKLILDLRYGKYSTVLLVHFVDFLKILVLILPVESLKKQLT